MLVIGGYNSSNTISLAALCDERVPTYPRRGRELHRRRTRHHPPPAAGKFARRSKPRAGFATPGDAARGNHRRREHAEQQDRRGRRAHLRHARRRSREHHLSDAPGYAKLHGGDASAVLVPALGGKVRDVHLGGRQWLWHNPDVPFAGAAKGARYAELEEPRRIRRLLPHGGIVPAAVVGRRSAPG